MNNAARPLSQVIGAGQALENAYKLIENFKERNATIVFTQDFHPRGHSSFASTCGTPAQPTMPHAAQVRRLVPVTWRWGSPPSS